MTFKLTKSLLISKLIFCFCFKSRKLFFKVKLGQKLASAIQKITTDFQIGFGSFVDKELMPYISLVPKDNCQQNECPGELDIPGLVGP